MSYDAGDVKATADLNRDPFVEGLRYCMDQGRQFGRMTFTATAAVDDQNARRQLAQLQIMMRRMSEESVDIDVNADTSEAIGELEALRVAQGRVGQSSTSMARTSTSTSATVRKNAQDDRKEFQLLRTAIEQLGPPLIPLAGGLLAASSAAVGLGAAGILAFKGIQAEIKAATPLGLQFAGGVRVMKDDLTMLEHTSAQGVLAGFQSSVVKINQEMPAFNANMAVSSKNLGDIGQHVVGGLIGGFNTFTPLIEKAEGYVDSLAAKFESWATGPGGAHFAQTLSTDLDHAIPALANLATTAEHLVSAFHPVGLGMLDTISNLSDAINHIPVPVLEAAATAYIAFRTAVTVTTGINAAAAALEKLAASEVAVTAASTTGAAAAAGGWSRATLYGTPAAEGMLARTATGLAAATRAVLPYAAAWAGLAVGTSAAASATEKWRQSTNTLKATLATTSNVAKDLFTFNWTSIPKDFGQAGQAGRNQASQAEAQASINNLGFNGTSTQAAMQGAAAAASYAQQTAQMTKLRATMVSTVSTVTRLSAANRELAAAGESQTLQYAKNSVAIERARSAAAAAAATYAKLQGSTEAYTQDLKANAAANAAIAQQTARAATAYSTHQGDVLGGLERNAFAQNPQLTAGVSGLQNYAKAVAAAQKSEESWTKVTDDNTIKIKGNTYETKAWNAAVVAANGDRAKAAGLLLGHTKALADDRVAAQGAADMQTALSSAMGAAETKYKLNDQQLNEYAALLGITSDKLATGEVSQKQFVAAVGRVQGVVDGASQSLSGWITAVGQFEQGTDTAASRGQLLASTMIAFNGSAISYGVAGSQVAAANQQFVTSFDAAKKGVVNLKTGFIDFHNAGSQPLLSSLSALQSAAGNFAAATYQDEVSTRGRTQAAKDAANVYYNDTHNALESEAKQLGITKGEADKLADRYFHWPKDARTQLELMGVEGTNKLLNGLGDQLSILTGKPWLASLDANTKPALSKSQQLQARLDAIKQNKVPNLDVHSNAAQAEIARLQAEIDALHGKSINLNVTTLRTIETATRTISGPSGNFAGGMYQFAAGGTTQKEDHRPAIYKAQPGMVRVFAEPETDWEAYIPGANDWRRPRAKQIAQETVSKLGGVAYFESGGFTGVTGSGGGGGGSSSGGGKQTGGSTTPKATSTANRWYYYDGLYYQGLEALNEAKAAHRAGPASASGAGNIASYGSGKTKAYGYGGSGYTSYQEASNARVQAERAAADQRLQAQKSASAQVASTLQGILPTFRNESYGIDSYQDVINLGKRTSDSIRTTIGNLTDTINSAAATKALPSKLVAQYSKDNVTLQRALNQRDSLQDKLKTLNDDLKSEQQQLATDVQALQQYGSQITSAFTSFGGFTAAAPTSTDVFGQTTTGDLAGGFLSSLHTAADQAQKFQADLQTAQREGMSNQLIQQFEQQGPGSQANLEALIKNQSSVMQANADYARLTAAATQIGSQAERDNVALNQQIAADNARIAATQAEISVDTKAMAKVQAAIDKDINALRVDVQKLGPAISSAITTALRKSS